MKEAPSWADTLPTHRIPAALAAEATSEAVAACARQGYRETAVVLDADGATIAKPEKATKQELAIEESGMDLFVAPTIGTLCLCHRSARPQRPRLDQRHSEPDGRVDCTSNNGGISLE